MEEKFIFRANDNAPEKQLGETMKETVPQAVPDSADAAPRTEVPEIKKAASQKKGKAPKAGKSAGKE